VAGIVLEEIAISYPRIAVSVLRQMRYSSPGFRFAPPWAEVHYAFGVFPRCYLLKNPLIAERF
jgi:hypothetical protein